MKLATPHDKFFKYVMSRIEAVHDFILNYVPPDVVQQFDLSSLAIRKDSFIDEKLAEHFSDMLYEIDLLDQRAGELYLLFEHKSFPKRQTIFDLLRYMVNIWQQQAEQRPKGQKLELKPIIPIIIYHSSSEWASPKSFIKLFSEHLPEELKPFIPDFQIVLCDLSQFSDSDIKGEVLLQIAFLFWKHFYTGELKERLPGILALLAQVKDQQTELEYLTAILQYLSEQKVEPLSSEELKTAVEEALPEGEETMLSLAEQWMAEGREEGLKKGREEGRQEARKEGLKEGEKKTLRRMFLRLLEHRFGAVPVDLVLRTEKLVTEQLNRLFDLAVDATSLDEIEQAMAV